MKTFICATLVAAGLTFPLMSSAGEFSGNVTLTTDYAFRGISQSNEDAALQGGFDYEADNGFYTGVWASSIDFGDGDGSELEIDLYTGFNGNFTDALGWNVQVLYYLYPEQPRGANYDFWELSAGWSYDFGGPSIWGNVAYSPDYFAASDSAVYSSGGLDVPIWENFSTSINAGYQVIDDNAAFGTPDYWDWGVAFTYAVAGFDITLAYTDTDLDTTDCFGGSELCADRAILSVGRSL